MFAAHEQYAAGTLGGGSLAIGAEELAGIDGSLYGARGGEGAYDGGAAYEGDRAYGAGRGYDGAPRFDGAPRYDTARAHDAGRAYNAGRPFEGSAPYETPRTFDAGSPLYAGHGQPMQARDYNTRNEADQSSHAQLKARGRDLAASIGATIEAFGGRPLSALDMMNPIGGSLGARAANENAAPGGMARGAYDLAGRPVAGVPPTLRHNDDVFASGYASYAPQRHEANPLTPPQSARSQGDSGAAAKVRDIISGGREGVPGVRAHSASSTEEGYRARLDALNADMERLVHQHTKVIALKDDALSGLSADLSDAKRTLEREVRARAADRERHTETVRALKRRISELESAVHDLERAAHEDRAPALPSDVQRAFNERITEMARSFALEKDAAIANQRAHLRAELELIIPKLKQRCNRAIEERVAALRAEFAAEYRTRLEERVHRLREETLAERRAAVREARERAEADGRAAVERVRAHYELKLMDMESACTRRVLDRLRRSGPSTRTYSEDAYL